jgi:hypothetical protein
MAKSLRCKECGATAFHINGIEGGYEVVCMSSQGKNHKMVIKGIQEGGLTTLQ